MNALEQLLLRYSESPQVRRMAQNLEILDSPRFQLSGMSGSQECFVLSGLYRARPCSHLFIADDKEEAAYVQNTLANLLEKKPVHFFPDSFKRPTNFEVLNNTNVLQRTETINKIATSVANGEIVVTYPEALFEQVVSPAALEADRIDLTVNETVQVDTIFEVLLEYGFRREDFVYEPGQFSVRGGIVDIYTYGNEYPYRVELFDDQVESIRTFDPLTQLSVQNIGRVSIIPNINTKFSKAQKTALFEVLKPDTVIWVRDFQQIIERLQTCFEKAAEFRKTVSLIDESELAEIFRDGAFTTPAQVVAGIQRFPVLFLKDVPADFKLSEKVGFKAGPQPVFNKHFELLIKDLTKNAEQRISNFIFTENPKQIERFYAIFEDLQANVQFQPVTKAIHLGFIDLDLKVACYTDHQIFDRFHRYKLRQGFTRDVALNVKLLNELQPGDFVTHIDHGVGKFSGLEKININGHQQESVRLFYKNNDILYVSVHSLHKIARYVGKDGTEPQLSKLGSEAWKNLKNKTKKQVKDIAGELIKLYAKRRASVGYACAPDGYLQNEMEASFIYEDTPDQLKATNDVKDDMMKPYPMDRLICGDVGFGKTEVAIRAAFKAVTEGKQVAVLVPTTILALQHYKTFTDRLQEFGVTIDYVNRFRSAKEKKQVFENLKNGKVEIIIGTHALLSAEVQFKDLGLLVVDEEQKFGVSAKEKLRNLRVNVDTLTLTATPIPRTLQFSLMAARDLSVIRTAPPNRQPIHTEVRVATDELIRDAIYYEVNRGGQVFFVHNRVKTLPETAAHIRRLCPDIDVAVAHGQMEAHQLEETLLAFIDRQHDVLVCTNIIETGLDIANANTIMIYNAHQFGMSDLHQLRGRVGRSNKKAFCYLFSPPLSTLSSDARKRLHTLEEFSELGSGFSIAMRDMDIRGAGNLLGAEQSGFISEIGFETFQRILDEAIQELKENEFRDLFKEDLEKDRKFVRDVHIETDAEMLLPDAYVESTQERLSLYTELDAIENEEGIIKYEEKLADRFGRLPKEAKELFEGLRLRWVCKSLGFERVVLKNNKLRCYFVENPQSPYYESAVFKHILSYVGEKGKVQGLSLKQSNRSLILVRDEVKGLRAATHLLKQIEQTLPISGL